MLIETLAVELECPRHLTAQVVNHLVGTYGIARDAIGSFLVNELPALEDWQIDLALAPLFTPTLPNQAGFAELLGRGSVPAAQWSDLIQQLIARPTHAQLAGEDGQTHRIPLRAVTIERFVLLLRLEATISEPLFKLISHLAPVTDRPLLKAIARRAAWANDRRLDILTRYRTHAIGGDTYLIEDAVALLKLVETYEPTGVSDLLSRIPHWQQVLRQEISEAAGPRPFFNERVQDMHGGGRDQRRQDNSRITAKENERAVLERLQRVLSSQAAANLDTDWVATVLNRTAAPPPWQHAHRREVALSLIQRRSSFLGEAS